MDVPKVANLFNSNPVGSVLFQIITKKRHNTTLKKPNIYDNDNMV